jgi:hypothetical protein
MGLKLPVPTIKAILCCGSLVLGYFCGEGLKTDIPFLSVERQLDVTLHVMSLDCLSILFE